MPTLGNLSEPAGDSRDSRHLLRLGFSRERSRGRYLCIGPAHST